MNQRTREGRGKKSITSVTERRILAWGREMSRDRLVILPGTVGLCTRLLIPAQAGNSF